MYKTTYFLCISSSTSKNVTVKIVLKFTMRA